MNIKLTFVLVLFALATISSQAKKGILIAHYGSSDSTVRAKSISLITQEVKNALPAFEVREAYISPVVRKRLAKSEAPVPSPTEALLKMATDGIDTVYVQSTTIIDGQEMAEVKESVAKTKNFFQKVVVGNVLCYSPQDCQEVAQLLISESPKENHIIFAGHGNMLPSTATYSQLDLMTSILSSGRCRVSTIEGYPDAQATAKLLNAKKYGKRVTLIPFLLICGNHTQEDIAVDFAGQLKQCGYIPGVDFIGLAERPAIRNLYLKRIKELVK